MTRLCNSTKRYRNWLMVTLFSLLPLLPVTVSAQLQIEVTRGVDNPTRIAIVPFRRDGVAALEDLAAIVAADLARSGQFAPLPRDAMYSTPSEGSEVHFRDWRALDVDYLVVGRSTGSEADSQLTIELYDVHRQRLLLKSNFADRREAERAIAHKASDVIYEKLTGIPGAFSSRMLYVSVKRDAAGKQMFRLYVADADGARFREALKSREPILSPSWSPDGSQIAYVSFESSRPAIYRQVLATGEREQLTGYPGLNGAPAWSPDGRQMAMVLSKDGNPELYVLDLASRKLRRLTNHYAIDTEPVWMPDGQSLLFTSDRGGGPQIYRLWLASGKVERVTFKGSYNAKASVAADGKSIVMIHRDGADYNIAWQDLASGRLLKLTRSSMDESPSLAPNGTMLLYATKHQGKGILAAVSVDGGIQFRLPSPSSDVREPAWSPR